MGWGVAYIMDVWTEKYLINCQILSWFTIDDSCIFFSLFWWCIDALLYDDFFHEKIFVCLFVDFWDDLNKQVIL